MKMGARDSAPLRWIGLLVAALACTLLVGGVALAGVGDLTFQGCFADTAAEGCTVPADAALAQLHDVAVSPDGDSVYVSSYGDDSVSHFSRAADGTLTYVGCFADTAAEGCTVTASAALAGATGVAVSPGGDSVYVASSSDDSISHFSRAAGGTLTYVGCFADTAAAGCRVPADAALTGARGVAVSPDGDSVYVASNGSNSVSHFSRAADGTLTYVGCFADTAAEGCQAPADAALTGARGVAVSPDGDSVYVASSSDDS